MSRIFITGSADGLGLAASRQLLSEGHEVVLHIRNASRREVIQDLLDQGVVVVTGDLADLEQTKNLAAQVNRLGQMDAVIHNAGVYSGPSLLPINVVTPYVLTALIMRPSRLIYLSSSMHLGGHAVLEGLDWSGKTESASYSDSKLLVTVLAAAIARRWQDIVVSTVDPGWVPTKMGGPNATDDLRLGHLTQEWLATTTDAQALNSGNYWHHQRHAEPHTSVGDRIFQDALINRMETVTGIVFPH